MKRPRSRGGVVIIQLAITITQFHDTLSVSRAYPRGCSHESPAFYDYDSYPFPPPNLPSRSHDDFALLRRLGAGKFSDVFEAVEVSSRQAGNNEMTGKKESTDTSDIDPASMCVIKCLKPVSERKIKRELLVLSHVSELPNLARLRAVVIPENYTKSYSKKKIDEGKMPSIVLQHAGPSSRWLSHGIGCDPSTLTSKPKMAAGTVSANPMGQHGEEPYHLIEYEIKYYLFHLLVALDALHSLGIMHRDVKPRNVLINRRWPPPYDVDTNMTNDIDEHHPLMLIDLGLADFYLPNQRYNVRVASRHYKAPELLLGYEYYDYGVDMWGVGCILAGLLLRREPFFRGKDNVDQLGKIVSILGKQDLLQYCDQYGIQLTKELERVVQKYTLRGNPNGRRKSWLVLLGESQLSNNGSVCPVPSQEGLDLLDKLLVYNHDERLTAREAMMHPFFDQVRNKVRIEIQKRWAKEQRA